MSLNLILSLVLSFHEKSDLSSIDYNMLVSIMIFEKVLVMYACLISGSLIH